MRKIIKMTTFALFVLIFAGCAGKNITTSIDKSVAFELNYQDELDKTAVTKEEIQKNLFVNLELLASPQYKLKIDRRADNNLGWETSGRIIEIKDDNLNIIYGNGFNFGMKAPYCEGSNALQETIAAVSMSADSRAYNCEKYTFPLNLQGNENNFKFSSTFPKNIFAQSDYRFSILGDPTRIKSQNAQNDALQFFNAISDKSALQISRLAVIKGDVNSKYDKESIKDNFIRLTHDFNNQNEENKLAYKFYGVDFAIKKLQADNKPKAQNIQNDALNTFANIIYQKQLQQGKLQNDNHKIDKEKSYYLDYNNVLCKISYKVYAYRGGAKVTYKILVPYTLYPNKTSSINKEDIKNIKQKIIDIIND